MPDLVIKGLDDGLFQRLKARATSRGRSPEGEVKSLLEREYRHISMGEALEHARQFRESLGRTFDDNTDLIREDRER